MTEIKITIPCDNPNQTFEELAKLSLAGTDSQIFVTRDFLKKLKKLSKVKEPKNGSLPPYGEIDIEWFEFSPEKNVKFKAAFIFFCDGEEGGLHRLVLFESNKGSYRAALSGMKNIIIIRTSK